MRTLTFFGLCLALQAAPPDSSPDLAGEWVLDRAASESQLPIPDFTLLVTQSAPLVAAELRFRTPDGLRVVYDTLVADGRERAYTFRRPTGQEGLGVRTSRWSADGTALEVADSVLLDAPAGPTPRWTTQRWSLSAARDTLTQRITLRQPFVSFEISYRFVRAAR